MSLPSDVEELDDEDDAAAGNNCDSVLEEDCGAEAGEK